MRARWGRRKRRLAVASLVALAVAVVAPLVAPSAGAVVANPGDIKIAMRLSVRTPTFTVDTVSTEGSGAATLRPNGLFTIPKASLAFASTAVHVAVPSPPPAAGSTDTLPPIDQSSTVVVTIVPTSDFYGGIDPSSGSGFVAGNVQMLWDQTGTLTGCTVGPFRVLARTNAPGASPYSTQTGKVSLVDPGFTIDAIPDGATGCDGYESGLNAALSLPVTTTTTTTLPNTPTTVAPTYPPNTPVPVPAIVVGLTFTPAPKRVVATPPTSPTPPPTTASATPPPNFTPPPPARRHRHRSHAHVHKARHHSRGSSHPTKPTKPAKHHKTYKPRTHRAARTPGTWLPGARPAQHKLARPAPRQRLNFVTAAFVKPETSVLATGLDVVAFIALLVFSSLALWLVTSEVSAVSHNARRLRAHRIAGVTKRR